MPHFYIVQHSIVHFVVEMKKITSLTTKNLEKIQLLSRRRHVNLSWHLSPYSASDGLYYHKAF